MKTSDFNYELPPELIAQTPIPQRDASRLLVLDKNTGAWQHRHFYDLPEYLRPGDCLILNNSRVLPARLLGHRLPGGGACEVLLLIDRGNKTWECLVRPGKRMRTGAKLSFGDGELTAEVVEELPGGNRLVRFDYEGIFLEVLERLGKMPLPPYIKEELQDQERYQTVYSKVNGSAAAPTAGLHFTQELLDQVSAMGVKLGYVTLHVGLGTFRPVKEDEIEGHEMHSEYCVIPQETADLISAALTLSQATGGAFDPTVAPLVTLWGITTDSPRVPRQTEIDALLPLVGVDHVTADGTHITLDEGCAMDLGGIAKGYASDRLADIFAQYGVDSALVSLGGNVYARGTKPGGQAWSVAVQHPEQEGYAAMLALTDAFAVTSGGYQRYFTGPDGTVYQHILDPETGWPVQGDLLSVTIVADNGTMADAYSTALYVMGREAAQDFWRQNGGFDMVLITKDGQVLYTPGLADKLTETEGSGYAYACIEP